MTQISTSRVALTLFAVFLSVDVDRIAHGDDPDLFMKVGRDYENAVSRANQRVSDAKQKLELVNRPLSAAKSRLSRLLKRPPKSVENWKRLRIGEFESEAEFRKRVSRAKVNDQRLAAEAIEQFDRQKLAAQRAVDQARKKVAAEATTSARELTSAQDAYRALIAKKPEFEFPVYVPKLDLPRFNRETMTFGPVFYNGPFGRQVPSWLDRAEKKAVQINDHFRVRWFVASPTLLKAKSFKEGLANGTIKCKITYMVKLKKLERPFAVTKSVTKEEKEIDWGTILLKFGAAALAQGFGGKAPPPGYSNTPLKKVRRTQTKTVTIRGTRYHYEFVPHSVQLVRKDGIAVPSTTAKVVKCYRIDR